MVHSLFEFSGHLTEFTVIEKLIESLPGGRVVMRRVVQPVSENCLTAFFVVFSLGPYFKLLPWYYQITYVSPLVDDRGLELEFLYLSLVVFPLD